MLRRLPVMAALLGALSACSGEPSHDDILSALQAEAKGVNDTVQSLFGPVPDGMQGKVLAVQKLGCQEDPPGWRCSVALTVQIPILGAQDSKTNMKFVRTDKGWILVH